MQVIKMDNVFLVVCRDRVAGVSMSKKEAVMWATNLYYNESHVRVEMWVVGEAHPTSVWVHDECREWWN